MVEVKDVKAFWEDKGMTYGTDHGGLVYHRDGRDITVEKGSPEFFRLVDEVFFNWNQYLHNESGRFGAIFPYERFRGKRVLEIGCGMGTHLSLWAKNGSHVFGVDVTKNAVMQTKKRFEIMGLTGEFINASGDRLPFPDNSFDYIYSWGVLHHIPTFESAFAEVERVLAPGGEVGIMLYHRRSFNHHFYTRFTEGFMHLENDFLTEIELTSRYGDDFKSEGNPFTRVFTARELKHGYFPNLTGKSTMIFGATDIRPILGIIVPGSARVLPQWVFHTLGRFFGWSLWFSAGK